MLADATRLLHAALRIKEFQVESASNYLPLQQIEQDAERNFFMSAQDALACGLIDQVIDRPIPIQPELTAISST